MMNPNTKKVAYLHTAIQNALNSFVIFGLDCQLCGKADLTNMELEHIETKALSVTAIYPCCGSHNRNKSNRDARNWFISKGLEEKYFELQSKIELFETVTQTDRDAAYILYMQQVTDTLRGSIDTLPDGILRLMTQPTPRNLLKTLDLNGVRIDKMQAKREKLEKYFDCTGVVWE